MCNCNSSFCAVCCRRVKAYRFDNVPEITGDLQLYTEFYKVGEAYGHWKFTVDDLEAYLDIPTVLWNDKLVAFGHTATGGLFYQSDFIFDYTTSSLTLGTRGVGSEGSGTVSFGTGNIVIGAGSFASGNSNELDGDSNNSFAFGEFNIFEVAPNSFAFGASNTVSSSTSFVVGAGNNTTGIGTIILGASLDSNGFYGNAMLSDSIGGSTAITDDAFTAQFAGGYRFRLDASSTAVNISSTGIVTIDNVVNNNTENQLLVWNTTTKEVEYRDVSSLPGGGGGSGTVTSVDAAFLNGTALTVVGGAITTAGTFDFEWQGLNTDYVAGDGSIIAFPTLTSGTVTSVSAGNGMTFTTITTSGAVTLGTPSSITLASTNSVGVGTHSHLFAPGGTTAQYIRGDGTLATTPLGSVTSVGMTITAATALSVAGSPITTSGTFAVTWTGSNTQYVAGDGSLITFPTLTSGTVTAVNSGAGMDFTNFTTSGTIILGTPSTITLASVNGASGTTHSHEFDLGGTAGQYLAGDNTLQTFPTIPTYTAGTGIDLTGNVITNAYTNHVGKYVSINIADSSYINNEGGIDVNTILKTSEVYVTGATNAPFSSGYIKTISPFSSYSWQLGKSLVGTEVYTRNKDAGVYSQWEELGVWNTYYNGSVYGYYPSASKHAIRSTGVGSGYGGVQLSGYNGIASGVISIYKYDDTKIGEIGYENTYLSYYVNVGNHRFGGGTVQLSSIPLAASSPYLIVDGGSGVLSYRTVASLPFTNNAGTVTSVDLALPASTFSISGNPVTTSGTLTGSFISQTAKYVLAAPWGIAGTPFWRQLLPSDLQQDLATTGQAIIWDGTKWTPTTISAGSGTVTSVTSGNFSPLFNVSVATNTTTPAFSFAAISQSQRLVYASPNSGSGNPSFRTLLVSDLGQSGATTGQVIAWNGSTWAADSNYASKWTAYSTYLAPTSSFDIRTQSSGTEGYASLMRGSASQAGYLEIWRSTTQARVGYIGFQNTYMAYVANIGNHQFSGGTVQIANIPTASTSVNLLTTNGGVIETRTIASLTGLPSSVWYLQGGTTASTNTSQNIYRTGDVWLNTGSTGAGGYKFRVTGDSYFEAQQYFAYATYQVWRNSANNAWLNGIRYNTSNQLELGQSSFDIYLPGYTSSRSVDTKTLLDKTLFVNSSGVVKSESSEWVRNDGASCWITSTESHLADNTNRRVTFDVSASTSNTYYTFSYSSGDYKMFFPGSYSQHLVICTLEYTTSGTPTVTATLRKTSTVIETNISTSADGRKVMTIHAIMSGTSSDYPTLYIYNATGGASITLQKCKITMIPLGETPP